MHTNRATMIVAGLAARTLSLVGLGLAGDGSTAAGASPSSGRDLGFEKRVAAQQAIEEVYWRHRIWPEENPGAKPVLAEVMSDDAIRFKVEDYLKKSNAMQTWWQRPVTAEQLQAELERMSKRTTDPAMLRDLYAALENDPVLIAETLARQTLVDRLIRNWYAADDRFHGEVMQDAERALASLHSVAEMKTLGGSYFERTYARYENVGGLGRGLLDAEVVELDAKQWRELMNTLAQPFGTTAEAIPIGQVSRLQEERDRFFVTAVLSLGADEVVVAGSVWPKRSFEGWWSNERVDTSAKLVASEGTYKVAEPLGANCENDTWEQKFYLPAGRTNCTSVWTGTEMIVWGGDVGTNAEWNTGGRYNPATDSWTETSTGENVPSARQRHKAVWTGTEMIVWGGSDGGSLFLDTGGRYDPSTDSWTPTSTEANVPSARAFHTAVWTGTEMIVWGGANAGVSVNTGGRYDPVTDSWAATSTGANPPSAQSAHTAVWTGTEMIVWGGVGSGGLLNTGARYDPAADGWMATSTGANLPSARQSHTAVWTGTEMIVWGGDVGSADTVNTGGRYDPVTDSWEATSTGANLPSARREHTAVWTDTEMIVWGGSEGGGLSPGLNSGGRYDPATDSWTATSTGANTPSLRRSQTAVWTGTEMIVWGGWNIVQNTYAPNTGGRYDPLTDQWTPTSTALNVPSIRTNHTTVWTGTEMIVWGGSLVGQDNLPLNSGGCYQPATDTWTATSVGANVPSARLAHTALWTGTEMLVWGGVDGVSVVFDTGSRYDPATDSWAPISTGMNVPSARALHTAVWTGIEMIVWGGLDFGGALDTGARYDPTVDGWEATSTGANLPSARSRHTAVWTGSEMIVWGGRAGNGAYLDTGGRYDLSTDSWTPTSTDANVPSARAFHTVVWTGSEMIVWGGRAGDGAYLDTGGRYDPSTDSWIPTSTEANASSARAFHTAVWTGTEMIVWGGFYDPDPNDFLFGFELNTGGRYEPSTDSWTATSVGTAVPPARWYHTAVWTGTKMIMWGGQPLDSNLLLYCAGAACPADLNGDGEINSADLALLLGAWGPNPGHVADLDGDGQVNSADLALLLGAWGPCP